MPGIFVDPDATFPVRVYYKPRLDGEGNETGVDLWNPEGPPDEDGWHFVTGFFRQVDEDSFGSVLEQATIINHVNHRPTLMTKVLRQRVLGTYMVGWDVGEDGHGGHPEDERIPIMAGWFVGSKFKVANRLFVEFMNAVDLVDVVRVAATNDEKFSISQSFQPPGFLDPSIMGGSMMQMPGMGDMSSPPMGGAFPPSIPLPPIPPGMTGGPTRSIGGFESGQPGIG